MIIRPMEPSEQEAVARLLESSYEHDYELDEGYRAEILDMAGREADFQTWVGMEDDEPVAAVCTPRRPQDPGRFGAEGEMVVRLLAVRPDRRGRGHAQAMMRHALEVARGQGYEAVYLYTGPEMVGAQGLYERMGFERMRGREVLVPEWGVAPLVYRQAV